MQAGLETGKQARQPLGILLSDANRNLGRSQYDHAPNQNFAPRNGQSYSSWAVDQGKISCNQIFFFSLEKRRRSTWMTQAPFRVRKPGETPMLAKWPLCATCPESPPSAPVDQARKICRVAVSHGNAASQRHRHLLVTSQSTFETDSVVSFWVAKPSDRA